MKSYLPFRLMFQVSHYARSNLHDRYLTSIFMTDVLPVRPFHIISPADNVWRRTELLGMNASNVPETTESGTKRIFRKFYTVAMLTEIPQTRFTTNDIFYQALRVLIPVVDREKLRHLLRHLVHNQPDPLERLHSAGADRGRGVLPPSSTRAGRCRLPRHPVAGLMASAGAIRLWPFGGELMSEAPAPP